MMAWPRALTEHAFRNLEVYGAKTVTTRNSNQQDRKDAFVRGTWKRRKAPPLEAPGVAGWGSQV